MQLYYDEVSSPSSFFAAVIALNSSRFVASDVSDYAPQSLEILDLLGVPTGSLGMSLFASVGKTSVIYSTSLWNLSLAMCNVASVTFDDHTGRVSSVQTTAFVTLPGYVPVNQTRVVTVGRSEAEHVLLNEDDGIIGDGVKAIRFLYSPQAGNHSGGSWPAFGYEYVATVHEHRHGFNYSILVVVDSETGNPLLVILGEYPTFYEHVFLPVWLPASLLVIGITLLILGLVAVSPEFAYALTATFIVPIFVRLKGSRILEGFNRGRIHGFITARPGCSYSNIKEAVGIGNGVLSYHLQVLERTELIKSIRDGRVRRFFPTGVSTALKQGQYLGRTESQVLHTLVEKGPQTNSNLAQLLGISRQRTHYNLRLLRRRGLATLENGAWMPVKLEGESEDHQDAEEPPNSAMSRLSDPGDLDESQRRETQQQTTRT
jgi:predicted transcriptional regulator